MINITHTYKRFENETDEELIYRITGDKELIGTWADVADILNDLLGTEYTESKFRKQRQAFDKMLAANQNKFVDTQAQLNEIEVQKRELERAKIAFRDERTAWQKQNYLATRVEQKLDFMESVFKEIAKIQFPDVDSPVIESDSDLLVVLSDLHIGQSFDSFAGSYNSDIAKERLSEYLREIIEIQKTHRAENCVISIQGDLISGNIHKTIAVTNRENVIQQVKMAVELISSFCHEIAKHFRKVKIVGVSGNHSRIDRKEEALHDERLDDLIIWSVGQILSNVENIFVVDNTSDTGIAEYTVRGKRYVSVHGDFDGFNKSSVLNLSSFLGYFPYAVVYGHMHTCALDEANGIRLLRGGSLAGSGDSYTIEKRLLGEPSQLVCVCTSKGIRCCYPIYF